METVGFSYSVPRERLSDHIARHIQNLIANGDLKVGDRLPPEPELGRQFGVSRIVIREAMAVLAGRGVLSIEPGRGTFVTALTSQDLSESFGLYVKASDVSVKNVAEIRQILEVAVAGLAAERATPEDVAEMERIILYMDSKMHTSDDVEEYLRGDVDFHNTLARATCNDILVALLHSLVGHFSSHRRQTSDVLQGNTNTQKAHRAILECVKKGDKEGAADAMRDHLQDVMERHRVALERTKGTSGVGDESVSVS